MHTTYYIIDGDRIVNAVSASSREQAQSTLERFEHPERLRLATKPPWRMLEQYEYWWERP